MSKAVIYEEFTHICPTGNGWVVGLEDCGYDVFPLSSTKYKLRQLDEFIDLIIIHGIDFEKANDIKEIKTFYPKTKICVLIDHYEDLYGEIEKYVDIWLTLCKVNIQLEKEFTNRNMKFGSVELASHPRMMKFYTELEPNKEFDISFIGTFGHGYRGQNEYLFPLIPKYKGIYAGFSFNGINYPYFPYSEVPHIYGRTKVNLNFHYPYNFGPDRIDLGGRTFDIAMSGNFQMCDHFLAGEYFKGSIPIVPKEEWEDQLKFYLKNESIRSKLAMKSYQICMAEHTYTHRIKKLLKMINLL
jgi:hypothetical protein